jgi:murein DD-endopeptidase MepM/ murein hydrolase activator NlpD
MALNKKAQVYPVFLAIFLLVALTFAFMALNDTKKICADPDKPCDSSNSLAVLGSKQTQVFYTLQDADSIKLFVDQAAKLAAEKSIDVIKKGCTYEFKPEGTDDVDTSECGKYIYPMWSNNQMICKPACEVSFTDQFASNLGTELQKYQSATKIPLPTKYDVSVQDEGDYFILSGQSTQKLILNSFSPNDRYQLEAEPSKISYAETKIQALSSISADQPTDAPSDVAALETDALTEISGEAIMVSEDVQNKLSSQTQQNWLWPTDYPDHVLNDCMGRRLLKGKADVHEGIDIRSFDGSKAYQVLAPAAGYVVEAGNPKLPDSKIFTKTGDMVKGHSADCWGRVTIYTGNGLSATFLHMQEIYIKPGQYVAPGTPIGLSGGRGLKNTDGIKSCSNDAYSVHIHMDVFKEVDTSLLKQTYPEGGNNPSGEPYARQTSFGPAINPLCLLDTTDATSSQPSNSRNYIAKNCYHPFNKDLEKVCPVYGLNTAGTAIMVATATDTTVDASNSGLSQVTGCASDIQRCLVKKQAQAAAAANSESAKYAFSTSFSVKVNVKLNPYDGLSTWFEDTWNECIDDPAKCLDESITEYNDDKDNPFTIKYGKNCESRPDNIFYSLMEGLEDCFSNNVKGCTCQFNFSGFTSSNDIAIDLNGDYATLSALTPSKAEPGTDLEEEGPSYSYYWGSLSGLLDTRRITLRFDDDENLKSIDIVGRKYDGESWLDTPLSMDSGTDTILLSKLPNPSGEDDIVEITSDPSLPACTLKKDKYRLCAEPRDEDSSLTPLFFSMQFREKTEAEKMQDKQECSDAQIEVSPLNMQPDSFVKDVAEIKGISISDVFSKIPIPIFQFLGTTIAVSDIMSTLPGTQAANLQIIVNNPDPDIIGYEVHCSDLPLNMGPDSFKGSKPNSFALLQEKANEAGAQMRLENNLPVNPYARFIQGKECNVPVPDSSGMVKNVPGIKAISENGVSQFTVKSCGGANIAMAKLTQNNYCIQLIPVRKDGTRLIDCPLTNCAEFNSLFDIALNRLLESQLSSISIIPAGIIPDDLKQYIKIPDANDFADAAMGKRSLDFGDIVNTDGIQSHYLGNLKSLITKELNQEVTAIAFQNALDSSSASQKQAVLSALSGQIKNEDAKMIFSDIVQRRNVEGDAQRIALAKGIGYIDDSDAKKILSDFVKIGDPRSKAYSLLRSEGLSQFNSMSDEQKKNLLIKMSESSVGSTVKDSMVAKAASKGCVNDFFASAQQAADCLSQDELSQVYSESMKDEMIAKSFIQKQLEGTDAGAAKNILSSLSQSRDFEGIVRDELASSIAGLPDSTQKNILSDIMNSNGNLEQTLQKEIMKQIPVVNSQYISDLLQNQDKAFSGIFKDEIQKSLNSFLSTDCSNT